MPTPARMPKPNATIILKSAVSQKMIPKLEKKLCISL